MLSRRHLISRICAGACGSAGFSLLGATHARAGDTATLPFANGVRPLVKYPQKRPLLQLTARPPQLETPWSVFDENVITSNDAFFVRYHLSEIPLIIDPTTFGLAVKGTVQAPLTLSLDDLKTEFEPAEVVSVNQCSGNSRGFFEPRVAGGQLANGAMGNARWKGVPLKAILDRAGVLSGARQVVFSGLDGPVSPETPDFAKALDIDHARDGDVMVAYEMNGEELPWLNGYPVRLVVPGYYGTYWVKHLNEITVLATEYDGFWTKTAYRIPDNACACTPPGQVPKTTKPIGRFNVRSFITNLSDGAQVRSGVDIPVRGIAFDGGEGISEVLVSTDRGHTWVGAALGPDLGRYSFRAWESRLRLPPGLHDLAVRAVNRIGQSQPLAPLWNPAGYMRNSIEVVRVLAG